MEDTFSKLEEKYRELIRDLPDAIQKEDKERVRQMIHRVEVDARELLKGLDEEEVVKESRGGDKE